MTDEKAGSRPPRRSSKGPSTAVLQRLQRQGESVADVRAALQAYLRRGGHDPDTAPSPSTFQAFAKSRTRKKSATPVVPRRRSPRPLADPAPPPAEDAEAASAAQAQEPLPAENDAEQAEDVYLAAALEAVEEDEASSDGDYEPSFTDFDSSSATSRSSRRRRPRDLTFAELNTRDDFVRGVLATSTAVQWVATHYLYSSDVSARGRHSAHKEAVFLAHLADALFGPRGAGPPNLPLAKELTVRRLQSSVHIMTGRDTYETGDLLLAPLLSGSSTFVSREAADVINAAQKVGFGHRPASTSSNRGRGRGSTARGGAADHRGRRSRGRGSRGVSTNGASPDGGAQDS